MKHTLEAGPWMLSLENWGGRLSAHETLPLIWNKYIKVRTARTAVCRLNKQLPDEPAHCSSCFYIMLSNIAICIFMLTLTNLFDVLLT